MDRNLWLGVVSSIVLAVSAVLLVNPGHLWMPTMGHMALLASLVVAVAAFGVFVLRESGGDERDILHRSFSGRAAFLAGGIVLLLAIIVESMHEALDGWLVAALVVMVLAKVAAHIYSARYR